MTNPSPSEMEIVERLKPCPFCGGEGALAKDMGESWVRCMTCEASTVLCSSSDRAIAAWNHRAPDPALEASLQQAREGLDSSSSATEHVQSADAAGHKGDAGLARGPSRAWDACYAIRNQLEAAKTSLIYNHRWTNDAGYITDAALWIERALAAADEGLSSEAPVVRR